MNKHTHTTTPEVHLVTMWPLPLTFWPQGQCMLSDCHALYVYQVWCW